MEISNGTVVNTGHRRYLYEGDSQNLKLTEVGGRRKIKKSYDLEGNIKKTIDNGIWQEYVSIRPKKRNSFVGTRGHDRLFYAEASYNSDGSLNVISCSNESLENLSERSRLKEAIRNIEKKLKDSADDLSVRAKKELNKMLNAAKAKLKVMV